jgi:hypothetical protein
MNRQGIFKEINPMAKKKKKIGKKPRGNEKLKGFTIRQLIAELKMRIEIKRNLLSSEINAKEEERDDLEEAWEDLRDIEELGIK